MHKAFFNIYSFFKSRKNLGLSVLALYLAVISFFAFRISFEEDITKLIPSGDKQATLKKVLGETDFSDKLIVTISANSNNTSADTLVSYAENLTNFLENNLSEYIREVKGKVADEDIYQVYNFVYSNLPIFLDEDDYQQLSLRISPDSIRPRLSSGYRQLMSPTGFVTKNYFFKDPLNFTNLGLKKLEELQVGDNFSIYKNYLVTRDRKNIVLFLDPVYPSSETNENEKFINLLQDRVEKLNNEYPGIEANYFGGVLYSLANAQRIKKDIQLTIGIAVALLFLLLLFFYRRFYIPLLLFLPSILGGISAIAILSIFKGNVSSIALGIGAVLLGISIDYALHILTHYRNNLNVKQLYKDVSKPIIMSSLTTAVAFLCLIFVKSEALLDLGIFASISVLFSSLFALMLIPLFYKPKETSNNQKTFLDKIAAKDYSKIKPLVIGVVVLFIASLFLFNKVEFNSDLSELNYQPENIKKAEEKVETLAGREGKTIYMVAYGNSVDEALQQNNKLYHRLQQFKSVHDISSFSSIGGVILSTSTQNQRIENWNTFWTNSKSANLKEDLISISSRYSFKPESFGEFYELLKKDFSPIVLEDYKNAGSLYLDDFISESENFATVTSTVSLNEENTDAFVSKFKNEAGIIALDRKAVNQNFLGNLKKDFNKLIAISVLAVFLILLFSYRNLEISLLTLLPIAVTWICALGIMEVLGLHFNILNIIISTFIFGLGLDYSIFITNACLKEYETGEYDLKTYQTSILISVITTLLGMGALIFARHPALKSVSVVSIIGILTAVTVSFVLQRVLFRQLILKRKRNGKPAFYFRQLADFSGRITQTETEKLYQKRAVLDNYRYKSIYSEARQQFRNNREKFLRVSRYINDGEKIAVINSGYGIIPLFLSYKFESSQISGIEDEEENLQIARNLPRVRSGNLYFSNLLEALENTKVFIINNNFKDEEALKKVIKNQAEKVIFIDSDFPNRWLLDLNYEIIYRQNNILVLKKAE